MSSKVRHATTGPLLAGDAAQPMEGAARLRAPAAPTGQAPLSFRQILVPWEPDGSSRYAVPWAEALAKTFGARVVLLSVMPPEISYEFQGEFGARPLDVGSARAQATDRARIRLERHAASLRRLGIPAQALVREGFPGDEVKRIIQEVGADLVILGSHAGGPLRRALVGSMADQVVGRPNVSLLVAKAGPSLKSIIAATDGSATSKRAVAIATRLAHRTQSHLHLVHAVDVPPILKGTSLDVAARSRAASMARSSASDPQVSFHVRTGRPAHAILREAAERDSDLIVVGSRSLRGLPRLFLGSVSSRVLHQARCSILVVKPLRPRRTAS